eukprot:scaffold7742_cov267-Pinguiococcus_pyrenoidosus.AAC.1
MPGAFERAAIGTAATADADTLDGRELASFAFGSEEEGSPQRLTDASCGSPHVSAGKHFSPRSRKYQDPCELLALLRRLVEGPSDGLPKRVAASRREQAARKPCLWRPRSRHASLLDLWPLQDLQQAAEGRRSTWSDAHLRLRHHALRQGDFASASLRRLLRYLGR